MTSFKVGERVRVLPKKPNGEDHPMAGRTGVVKETLGLYLTGPGWPARALIAIDAGCEDAGNIMIVGFGSLEKIK